VAKNSQIINALISAARNGKRVLAVIELQARFDEENNIAITRALTEAGVRVIPGVHGLKVHCKLIQISRKEAGKTVRYVHIGTGNFHEKTANIYSDTTLLTANQEIGAEVRRIFEFFESNFVRSVHRHLVVSPFNTRRKFIDLINAEIELAEKKKPASITIKMNNLVDPGMIRKLYEASNTGVKIQLIIRGICSLIPGIPGKSQNIEVISVVGRYLEHSRIIVFGNGGKPLFFISSADWMGRNIDHRIEVSTPIFDEDLKKELQDYLNLQLDANAKVRIIDKSLRNDYRKPQTGKNLFDCQMAVYDLLAEKKAGPAKKTRVKKEL
jgi:polyphosphate kinase